MKALENKTMDSKMEMDILEGLDEIRTVNAIHQRISPDELLEHHLEQMRKNNEHEAMERTDIELGDEDEELLDMLAQRERGEYVQRLEDTEQDEEERAHKRRKAMIEALGPVISLPKSASVSNEECEVGGFKAPLPRLPPKSKPSVDVTRKVLNGKNSVQIALKPRLQSAQQHDKQAAHSGPIIVKGEGSSDEEDENGSSTGLSLVSY